MGVSSYKMEKVEPKYPIPTVNAIYKFARHLFIKAQLSAECSIVCLVYVERLMKKGGLLLLSTNWRPVLLCGLLLASKVCCHEDESRVTYRTAADCVVCAVVARFEQLERGV